MGIVLSVAHSPTFKSILLVTVNHYAGRELSDREVLGPGQTTRPASRVSEGQLGSVAKAVAHRSRDRNCPMTSQVLVKGLSVTGSRCLFLPDTSQT